MKNNKRVMLGRLALAAGIGLAAGGAPGQGASEGLLEQVKVVPLERGSEIRLVVSKRQGATPNTALLLFAGYPGVLKVADEGGTPRFELAGNFLLRARRFLNNDRLFTVLVDCPVDRWTHCDDAYRSSAQHAADVAAVIAALKADAGAQRVYIVGTSYGTVSSSHLAAALADRIDGAVHTATFTDPRAGANAHGKPMASFDWSKAATPQLFVHHREDPCDVTRYGSVAARRGALPLITVEGQSGVRGEPCLAFTQHGFVGREKAVMTAIADWVETRKAPEVLAAN